MFRKTAEAAKRTSALASFPSAIGGWASNQNLATPSTDPQCACILENIFPTATGGQLRRGSLLYATLGNGDMPCRALFSFQNGSQSHLFAATDTTIYDVTNIITPYSYRLLSESPDHIVTDTGDFIGQISTAGMERIEGLTNGAWIDLQFATTGSTYLLVVNGSDPMQVYDGDMWYPITGDNLYALNFDAMTAGFSIGEAVTGGTSGATATIVQVKTVNDTGTLTIKNITGTFVDNETITSATGSATTDGTTQQTFVGITGTKGDGNALQTSDFSYVWAYQGRLWFIEKGSTSAWYLPVDQIGGEAKEFPLIGTFARGGYLVLGQTWSLDSGNSGGLSAQCVFVSSEGEAIIYQGTYPEDATTWSQVNTMRIGKPQGPKSWIRAGGDIVIATDIGFVPLSIAAQRDFAALPSYAVSSPINANWAEVVQDRGGNLDWHAEHWANRQMAVITVPSSGQQDAYMLIVNSRTGAWAKFTGWDGLCLEVFKDRLFYGSKDGKIIEAYVTGYDQGKPYTGVYAPLFSDGGDPGTMKLPKVIRAVIRSPRPTQVQMDMMYDYEVTRTTPPSAVPSTDSSAWGEGIWGQSIWGEVQQLKTTQQWVSASGYGYSVSPLLQVTSGSLIPLDVEIVRIDLVGEATDIVAG